MITLNAHAQIPIEIMAAHKLEHGSGLPPNLLDDLAMYLGRQLIESKYVEFEMRENVHQQRFEVIASARVLEPGEQKRVPQITSFKIGGTYDRI